MPPPAADKSRIEVLVERQLAREIANDRREARRGARSRCRARTLLECAQQSAAALGVVVENAKKLRRSDVQNNLTLRPMSALELGFLYAWMAADEATGSAPKWWGSGAVGIQQSWEAASGWYDEQLDTPPGDESSSADDESVLAAVGGRRPAEATVEALSAAVASGDGDIARSHLGAHAAKAASSPPVRGPHVLGAFVRGQIAPIGFVATKDPVIRRGQLDGGAVCAADWTIDAMGTRLSGRGCGIGTALALHCINAAERAGDSAEYRVDVIPSAIQFWRRLDFVEVEATGEQAFFMAKGGDRPMVRKLLGKQGIGGKAKA